MVASRISHHPSMTIWVTVIAVLGTLVGAIGGPVVADWRRRRGDSSDYSLRSRVQVYRDFAATIEGLQLLIDSLLASDDPKLAAAASSRFSKLLRECEIQRAHIDVVGSAPVRGWAYRSRLCIEEAYGFLSMNDLTAARRARQKLHDARKMYVESARDEVGVAPRAPDLLASGHDSWLREPPSADAAHATGLIVRELDAGSTQPSIDQVR